MVLLDVYLETIKDVIFNQTKPDGTSCDNEAILACLTILGSV